MGFEYWRNADYQSWQHARQTAFENGIPLDDAWHDFDQFLSDIGERPTKSHCNIAMHCQATGYVPGNCFWSVYKQPECQFRLCDVAMSYLKAKVIDEETASMLANIDADIDVIRQSFRQLDSITKDMSAAMRTKAIAARVQNLSRTYGEVPDNDVNRWQIHHIAQRIKRENHERNMEAPIIDEPDLLIELDAACAPG